VGGADDGLQVKRFMTGPGNITPDVTIEGHEPEAEHAFSGVMQFYVPTQRADGTVEPVDYYNIDVALVETRETAKPLVNVFIYGPALGVDGTAFAHSFMDTYGAVSFDDGETWKSTNLSESATLTSFDLNDHEAAEPMEMPADHRIKFGGGKNAVFHADGYDQPYTAHCTECHGRSLTGTAQAPSCYSCHDHRWEEDPPANIGPILYRAIYKNNKIEGVGENADPYPEVEIVDGLTGDELFTENVTLPGTFNFTEQVGGKPPCTLAARNDDELGPAIPVTDKNGEALNVLKNECKGLDVDLTQYPGGTYNVFHAVAGNRVLVAWPSRFCEQGQPAYSMDNPDVDQTRREAIAAYLGIDLATASPDDLYLVDMFGVGGSQDSIDFADEGYPQAGIVPYGCVWTARGVLVDGDDPRTEAIEEEFMRWFNAERLTSGRRDPNRIEVKGVEGAGFAITWQEDPDGLRPGQGLGPGEGWSGAVAHDETDVWYSYIDWEWFDVVQDPSDDIGATAMAFLDYEAAAAADVANVTQKPKPFVPMAMPMRVTDNAKCNVENPQPYCNGSAISANFPDLPNPVEYGLKDLCAATIEIPLGPNDEDLPICVSEDGFPNVGNVAATRPRLGLFGYDSDNDTVIDNAFVVFQAEESKGLGAFGYTDLFDSNASACDPEVDDGCIPFDEGKNQWYYSFSMRLTDAMAADPLDGLLANLAGHGNMLNQPEVSWEDGDFYPARNTVDMWDFGAYNYDIFNTEIARRASLLAQGIGKAVASQKGLLVMPSWKQGIMRQGGPADTMVRRIVVPGGWTIAMGNPYAFRNMVCDSWAYKDGSNPMYPEGLCLDSAINLSAVVPDTCVESDTGADEGCPEIDLAGGTPFGITETNPVLQGNQVEEPNTTKVLTWHQCQPGSALTEFDCTDRNNLTDQSWYNPLDVSKGHRGFIDGDFVMFLYAWSPTWRLNAKGHDRYELYIRRSFDGGQTWTTLPGSFLASDGLTYSGEGTTTCETYRSTETGTGEPDEPHVCYTYAAGDPEQARNVTQHQSMRFTTLDPRYAATAPSITADPFDVGVDLYLEDVRDPSRYFIVFETGDNTTVEVGEAEPLDLYYSRAVNFGDQYQVWAEEDDLSVCYPSDSHGDDKVPAELLGSGFCNEFDQMESGTPGLGASEASLSANPGGEFLYGVWSQIDEVTEESDAMARRVWWIDGYISATWGWDFGQGPQ